MNPQNREPKIKSIVKDTNVKEKTEKENEPVEHPHTETGDINEQTPIKHPHEYTDPKTELDIKNSINSEANTKSSL